MPFRVVINTEVGRSDTREGFLSEARNALMPALQMQLGWRHRDSQVLIAGDANTAYISGKTDIFEEIGVMMLGMSGGVDRDKSQVSNLNFLRILRDYKLTLRN